MNGESDRRFRADQAGDDLRELVTGSGTYLGDIIDRRERGEVLHAVFVRSELAHARLLSVDTAEAKRAPGVVAVYEAGDLGDLIIPPRLRPNMVPADGMDRHVLASGRVRYVGEPIVMVVADSPVHARDAAEAVWVDYQELEPVIDPTDAPDPATLLFPDAGSNVVERFTVGGPAPTPAADEIAVTVDVVNQRVAAVALETIGILVDVADGGLTVTCGHQMPHRLRLDLAAVLDIAPERIRVIVPDTGGAFGLKGAMYPEYAAVSKAALELGRSVAWREGRREHLMGGTHGRDQQHTVTIIGDRDGRFRAVRVEALANLGAYPSAGSFVPRTTASCAQGPYDFEEVSVEVTSVVTNTAPIGPYRGAGRPEATYALETAVDSFAREIGLDPTLVRKRNLIRPEQMPYHSPTGAVYDGGDYGAALAEAERLLDIEAVRRRQASPSAGRRVGVGLCMFVEPAGGAPGSGEYARVDIGTDGGITVFSGSISAGQRHGTVFRRLAGEALGVDPVSIRMVAGDTAEIPRSVGTFGSRSMQVGATAMSRAAIRLEGRARRLAAAHLEVSDADLRHTGTGYEVAGVPGSEITFAQLAESESSRGERLMEEDYFESPGQTFPYGAYGAVVSIELETGDISVERLVAVDDCGAVLDRAGAHGQILGGIAQGLGQALSEAIEYDSTGQLLTGTLTDYRIPGALMAPEVLLSEVLIPSDLNELGARGVGEAGTIGAPAAVSLAIADALGEPSPAMPFRPERIWQWVRRGNDGP